MRRALVVVGKAPVAGASKTRLLEALSAEASAALARAFLLDALEGGLGLRWEQVTLLHPNSAAATVMLETLVPTGVELQPQNGSGLGDALASAFAGHFAAGFERVVVIGADSPTLPPEFIQAAVESSAEVAIGPSLDGGYYLLGLRSAHCRLFESIDWSTDRVYRQTLERARELGLSVEALPPWYDVDTPADLERLRIELHLRPAWVAPHTRALLAGTRIDGDRPEAAAYDRARRSATA